MAIVGDRPSHGVRLRLDRKDPEGSGSTASNPVVYEGRIWTSDADFDVRVEVAEGGELNVVTEAGKDLAEKTRLIVRTVLRHAKDEGQPAPRSIQRWRA